MYGMEGVIKEAAEALEEEGNETFSTSESSAQAAVWSITKWPDISRQFAWRSPWVLPTLLLS